MEAKKKLLALRERARAASEVFEQTVRSLGKVEYTVFQPKVTHDNIKTVESDAESFEFSLDPSKQQVVVVLQGNWTMTHGNAVRKLTVSDVVKIPLGSSVETRMATEEKGAKFVYIQFK